MSELQDQSVEDEGTSQEAGADLATDSAAEREEKDPAALAQEQAQKAINRQHAKYREEERKRIEAESKAKELEERLSKLEQSESVEVPEMPEAWDENFEAKMAEREAALMRQAQVQAQQSFKEQQAEASRQAAEQAEYERLDGLVADYNKRSVKLGLTPEEVKRAGDTVVSYGVDADVAEFILQHENGPLITKYLANNPLELDELSNMSPIQAALTIESKISHAAETLKPQATNAPDPVETLGGRGAGEKVSPLIKGARFD